MKDALSIHRLLLERQTTHEIVRLPKHIGCADDLPEVLGLPPFRCLCTRIFLPYEPGRLYTGRHPLVAVIVTAGSRPAPSVVAEALDVPEVRPAPVDLINEVTDYAAELVAPLLLPANVVMFVDQQAACVDDVVYTATGEAWTALGIHTLDLFALCDAKPTPIPCTHASDRPRRSDH
ncbi:YbaK/EbsC family protein [Actinoallomurus purpureus]|uniref:aminoacyl-tRNA deacylase n=1 Tax=Actinoallomurus purpureus TaxID=478114 RepID=UPI0020928188|nr:YbaK/EbsC family protein [Actinoallomurus purpureus]MCO6007291.1 YbaK/EbsC family protein [Actinoallomurus purpureus]